MKPKLYRALGLMSGTSIDGMDAALIETDGADYIEPLGFMGLPYGVAFRDELRRHLGNPRGASDPAVRPFERELTDLHARLALTLIKETGVTPDVIGFHGQTLYHRPERKLTVQIGDGDELASLTGIPVVNDFRSADVLAGGHGAPLVPLYHRALLAGHEKPALILNIGGVSNVTWIGGDGDDEILAFDVGPGNALIDDWVLRHTGHPYDEDGLLAAAGKVDEAAVARALSYAFFAEKPPKSLDRDAFQAFVPDETLDAADGAATLTMITARAVAAALPFLPRKPKTIYVAGGGRHNLTMMRWIGDLTGLTPKSVDLLGWSGDGLEAEAFAWLAVRSLLGKPLSLPTTTGVPRPMTGGKLHLPPKLY